MENSANITFQIEYTREESKLMYVKAPDMATAFRLAEEYRKLGKVKYDVDPDNKGYTCIVGTVNYDVKEGEWINDDVH